MRPTLVLVVIAWTGCLEASDFRVFTNTQGVQIRARLLAVQDGQATIAREDGTKFTVPVTAFSAEDQQFIQQAGSAMASGFITRPSPNDKLPVEDLNSVVGAPIFGDTVLWESDAATVAAKLQLRPESQTKAQSSYRSYPPDDYRLFGARPYSVALYAEEGKPTQFSMVFANKGDLFGAKGSAEQHFDRKEAPKEALKLLEDTMKKDVDAVTTLLSTRLGEPQKQRFGEGEGRRTVYRWDWRGHSILLSEVDQEYVGIEVATQAFADAGGKSAKISDSVIRGQVVANLELRDNGDRVIRDIPMVDQGPKGYCVPATAERVMRYMGVPADMYVLAMAGGTQIGGGTDVNQLLDAVGRDIRRKGRTFDRWSGAMKFKDLAKHLDKGLPVMWSFYSSDEWNETANRRTEERRQITDWEEWKVRMKELNSSAKLPKDTTKGHVVLIMGYNPETEEIAFSDSWGERFKERWMTLAEAESVSQGSFWVVGF